MTINELIEQLQEAARIIGANAPIGTVRADKLTGVEVRGAYALITWKLPPDYQVPSGEIRVSLGFPE